MDFLWINDGSMDDVLFDIVHEVPICLSMAETVIVTIEYFRYMALGIALRYVLEALRKPHGSKMYFFGIAALDRFKTRLKDYPSYCQHLATIPHFSQFPPQLIEVRSGFKLVTFSCFFSRQR